MTNLIGKFTCCCKRDGHASVDIGWWRIARGCLWLCCMLIISHRQGDASFEGGFVTIFRHSSVAMNVKLHNYYVHIAECQWAYLLPFNFLFQIFSDLSFYAMLQKLTFSKAYCKAHKYFFNSQSSCGTACGCGHFFCLWYRFLCFLLTVVLFIRMTSSIQYMCIVCTFCSCCTHTHFLWPGRGEQHSFVFHWSCPKLWDTRNKCDGPKPIQDSMFSVFSL